MIGMEGPFKNAVLLLLKRHPQMRALDLWSRFNVSRPTVYELVGTVKALVQEGRLPAGFVLAGLRSCPYCQDRYFLRRQDKIDHLVEHARFFPGTVPRFEARWKAKEERRSLFA